MKRTIKLKDGKEIEGTVVAFDIIKEDWNSYDLNDGTSIKMRTTVLEILRLNGQYNEQGDTMYHVVSKNDVVVTSIPEHLRKDIK